MDDVALRRPLAFGIVRSVVGQMTKALAGDLLAFRAKASADARCVELAAHRAPLTGTMAMAPMRAQAPATVYSAA
jgi:hypothetical protein